jgi:hypothetical protein
MNGNKLKPGVFFTWPDEDFTIYRVRGLSKEIKIRMIIEAYVPAYKKFILAGSFDINSDMFNSIEIFDI